MDRAELVRKLVDFRVIAEEVRSGEREGAIEADGIGDGAGDLVELLDAALDHLKPQGEPALRLLAWSENFGRQGTIGGLIVVNAEEYAKVTALCDEGATVHLGEVLGKHSDISIDLDSNFFTEIAVSEEGARAISDHADECGTPILGAMMDLYDDEYAEDEDDFDDEDFDDKDAEDDDEFDDLDEDDDF